MLNFYYYYYSTRSFKNAVTKCFTLENQDKTVENFFRKGWNKNTEQIKQQKSETDDINKRLFKKIEERLKFKWFGRCYWVDQSQINAHWLTFKKFNLEWPAVSPTPLICGSKKLCQSVKSTNFSCHDVALLRADTRSNLLVKLRTEAGTFFNTKQINHWPTTWSRPSRPVQAHRFLSY